MERPQQPETSQYEHGQRTWIDRFSREDIYMTDRESEKLNMIGNKGNNLISTRMAIPKVTIKGS